MNRENILTQYREKGFAIIKVFDDAEVRLLESFASDWLYGLLNLEDPFKREGCRLSKYHEWYKTLPIEHSEIFCAKKRHVYPNNIIQNILFGDKIKLVLDSIGVNQFKIWDEGLGTLAFRFIRPGFGDGYPMSRKAWGPAKDVISFWIPIIGMSPTETITLVPGSHLKDYDKFTPENSKFTKDEYRLAQDPSNFKTFNPIFKRGEILCFHPMTLHSEDVVSGPNTRLSLEFRIQPLNKIIRMK